jgi:hypothetical protein
MALKQSQNALQEAYQRKNPLKKKSSFLKPLLSNLSFKPLSFKPLSLNPQALTSKL